MAQKIWRTVSVPDIDKPVAEGNLLRLLAFLRACLDELKIVSYNDQLSYAIAMLQPRACSIEHLNEALEHCKSTSPGPLLKLFNGVGGGASKRIFDLAEEVSEDRQLEQEAVTVLEEVKVSIANIEGENMNKENLDKLHTARVQLSKLMSDLSEVQDDDPLAHLLKKVLELNNILELCVEQHVLRFQVAAMSMASVAREH